MIQNIEKGRGFKGAAAYVIEKEGAKIIGGTMLSSDVAGLNREAAVVRSLNKKLGRAVFHSSLSISKEDKLDDRLWNEIANKYMNELGFENSPFFVARHSDTDNDHIHIVALRIDTKTKKTVNDSKDFERGALIIQQLEEEYGLKKGAQTPKQARQKSVKNITHGEIERAIKTGKAPPRLLLQQYVNEAMKDKPSIFEFVDRLENAGVDVYPSVASTGRMNGFKFAVDNVFFKASDLGKKYGWKQLKENVIYEQARDSAKLIEIANNARLREHKDDSRTIENDRKLSSRHDEINDRKQGDAPTIQPKSEENNAKNGAGTERNTHHEQHVVEQVGAGAGGGTTGFNEDSRRVTRSEVGDKQQINNSDVDSLLIDVRDSSRCVADLSAALKPRGNESNKMVSVDSRRKSQSNQKPALAPDHIKKLASWQRQHNAIGAPAYRITVVPRRDDTKKTFNMGKSKDGGDEKFFTYKEVESLIPQLRRQNALGSDIYITPIDPNNHYILLDDTTENQVKELKESAGFTPILVQQSSVGNVQAVYKASKKQGKNEQSTANKLMQSMNKKYGDEKISGVVHPFRLAGFSNAKPKKEVKGKRPFITILETNKGDDAMSLWLQQLREQDAQKQIKKEVSRRNKILSVDNDINADVDSELNYTNNTLKGYQSTYKKEYSRVTGLAKSKGWELDMSKVDFKISQQMLKAGYSENEVKQAILDLSPSIADRHSDALRYAEKTVNAALMTDEVQNSRRSQAQRGLEDRALGR